MLHKPNGKQHELLLALEPRSSIVDHKDEIYGEYWYDHNGMTLEERQEAPASPAHIDFLCRPRPEVVLPLLESRSGCLRQECPTGGTPETAVDGFKMPIGQLKLYVETLVTAPKPQVVPIRLPFVKDRLIGQRMPVAKLRMTVDDNSEEFWLFSHLATPDDPPRSKPNSAKTVEVIDGKNRVAALTMPIQAIDIGFRVRLAKFERKLDPGTDQPSHYSSWVDFVDHDADRAIHSVARADATPQSYLWPKLQRPATRSLSIKRLAISTGSMQAQGNSPREVERSRQQPSQHEIRIGRLQRLESPCGIVVDGEAERLYWADSFATGRETTGVIRAAGIDGDNIKTLVEINHAPEVMVLDSDQHHLYFTSRATKRDWSRRCRWERYEREMVRRAGASGRFTR